MNINYKKTILPTALFTLLGTTMGSLLWGCSSGPRDQDRAYRSDSQERAAAGPVIIRPRAETPLLLTTADLSPAKVPNVLAEIKPVDLNSHVSAAKLRLVVDPNSFKQSDPQAALSQPFDIPMKLIAGTTWGAVISDDQLKKLAINGEEVSYVGRIFAKSDNGGVSVSDDVVRLRVRAPIVVEKSSG